MQASLSAGEKKRSNHDVTHVHVQTRELLPGYFSWEIIIIKKKKKKPFRSPKKTNKFHIKHKHTYGGSVLPKYSFIVQHYS